MIINSIDLVNYTVAMEMDVGYKVVVVLFGNPFLSLFLFFFSGCADSELV